MFQSGLPFLHNLVAQVPHKLPECDHIVQNRQTYIQRKCDSCPICDYALASVLLGLPADNTTVITLGLMFGPFFISKYM